jgi:polysaccharide export outer membrane protein
MSFASNPSPLRRVAVVLALMSVLVLGSSAGGAAEPEGYHLASGDRITVTIFGQPELSGDAVVDQNGNLRLPIIGEIQADTLTLGELEGRIAEALKKGYLRDPVVSVRVVDFRPVYVLGLVRIPGSYPYRYGLSALGAIALAGGLGTPEDRRGALVTEVLQTEERVRQLELSRAALTVRRARLEAEQSDQDNLAFPDQSGSTDPDRLAQFVEAERRAFVAERDAERQETDALQSQIPTLQAEIASLKQQQKLEQQQRDLNHEMVAQYERMLGSGLVRKPNYIEVKREESRLDSNIERLRSETLRAQQAIGNLKFRIGELRHGYRRRATAALQEVDRALLELSVSLPSAQRIRAARAAQIGAIAVGETNEPALAVVRGKISTPVAFDAAGNFRLQPGDIVQVGSLVPAFVAATPAPSGAELRAIAQRAATPSTHVSPARAAE